MPDREKVIKDLEECLSASCRGFRPRLLCPYNDEEWDIMRDALALLKEQEAAYQGAVELLRQKTILFDDAIKRLKGQEAKIEQLNRFVNGFSRDAVHVVRCKDCKYYDYHNGCMSWHDVNSKNDNWHCADGERRDDDA